MPRRNRSAGLAPRPPAPRPSPAAHSPAPQTGRSAGLAPHPPSPRPSPASHSPPPKADPPRPAARSPSPPRTVHYHAPVHSSSDGSFFQGMSFGSGNAIAHRAVDAVMGPPTIKHETVVAPAPAAGATTMPDACGTHSKAFQDCLNSSSSDIGKCQFYMDMLVECRKNSMLDECKKNSGSDTTS